MRPVVGLLAFLAACGSTQPRQRLPDDPVAQGYLADEERFVPSYDKAELKRALIAERGAEATGERIVRELEANGSEDQLRVARANLDVRRRFIASLEACEAAGRWCPPRLDDPVWNYDLDGEAKPPLDAPLHYDLAGFRAIASELFGRACACRTIGCVDSVGVAIDRVEQMPDRATQGDEAASVSLTRARECLFRLRGKAVHARVRPTLD